jgi:hypothetical protein
MPSLEQIHADQDRGITALVSAFEQHLKQIVSRAETRVIAILQARLATENGSILRTPGNSRLLRRVDVLFTDALDKEGYQRLVDAYVNQFAGQIPFFQETLAELSRIAGTSLGPVRFTGADKASFAAYQLDIASAIRSAVEGAAGRATQQALFNVAGLKFGALVELLKEKLNVSVAQAKTLADTGVTSFIRTVNARGYEIVEEANPSFEFRYRYFGPLDKKNRPFCRRMEEGSKAGAQFTRAEIDKMDNGLSPVGTVFTLCGFWNCRHVWLLVPIAQSATKAA